MALREEVVLSIQRAQQQISQLETQLAQLSTPLVVPVDVQGEEAVTQLRQQLDAADETVDVRVDTQGIQSAESQFQGLSSEIDDTEDELRDAQIQADRLGDELNTTGQRGVSAFGNLRASLGPLIATFAAGLGLREIVGQFSAAVTAASDLEQSIGGVRAIFGEAADDVLAFGEEAAQAVGLSANAFNQLTSQVGAQLQSFGFSLEEAGDESIRLVELGADLAATFGGPVSDAVEAIGSLLRGEINPIERYGVAVNQAAITANALEEGLVETAGAMDIQSRALSALDLLFEQTTGAQGQFNRESDTTAGRLERLRAEFANTQAEIGQALIPAFEELLDQVPGLIDTLGGLAPAFAGLASQVTGLVSPLADLATVLGLVAGPLATVTSTLNQLPESENQLLATLGQSLQAVLNPAGAAVDAFNEIKELFTAIDEDAFEEALEDIAEALERGVDPAESLRDALAELQASGPITAEALRGLIDAAGLEGAELEDFLRSIVVNARELGLSASEIDVVTAALAGVSSINFGGAIVGFENLAGGVNEFAEGAPLTAAEIEGLNEALEGIDFQALVDDFPVIIRDLEDLAIAAEEAGVDVVDFVNNLPDNITLDLSGPETEVLSLIETLDGLETRLAELNEGQFANIELPELEFDASGAVTNLDEVIAAIVEQAGEDAQIEANLSEIIIGADAIDLAGFIRTLEPEVQSALAASFAAEQQLAGEAQAALDGTMEGLAAGAAEQLAETLGTATPEQLAQLGVFAEDNFVSQVVRNQLAGTAGEIAAVLSQGIADSPNLVLDMTDAEISDLTAPAQTIAQKLSDLISSNIRLDPALFSTEGTAGAPSGTNGGGGGNPNVPPVEVTINNPTTEDLSTSATQAAQTIGAVSSSLSRVQ